MSYYNTNNLKEKKLIESLVKAKAQKQKVKIIMNCYGKMTASEVYEFFPKNTPITSIRRSLSDLQKEDKFLVITDEMKDGPFGSPEHYYKVHDQLTLF